MAILFTLSLSANESCIDSGETVDVVLLLLVAVEEGLSVDRLWSGAEGEKDAKCSTHSLKNESSRKI